MNVTQNHTLRIGKSAVQVVGPGELSPPGFALIAETAGTVTIITGAGQTVTIPVVAGVPVYIEHTHIIAGTATGVVSIN